MKKVKRSLRYSVKVLPAIMILLTSGLSYAQGVDEKSIFPQARWPASELDLLLQKVEQAWNLLLVVGIPSNQKEEPRITKSKVGLELRYRKDRIRATAWIQDLEGFLSLTYEERKTLLVDVLNNLTGKLFRIGVQVDERPGYIQKKHIVLTIIIAGIANPLLTEDLVGRAGYMDGKFIYSEKNYLKLQRSALFSDKDKIIIERSVQ